MDLQSSLITPNAGIQVTSNPLLKVNTGIIRIVHFRYCTDRYRAASLICSVKKKPAQNQDTTREIINGFWRPRERCPTSNISLYTIDPATAANW